MKLVYIPTAFGFYSELSHSRLLYFSSNATFIKGRTAYPSEITNECPSNGYILEIFQGCFIKKKKEIFRGYKIISSLNLLYSSALSPASLFFCTRFESYSSASLGRRSFGRLDGDPLVSPPACFACGTLRRLFGQEPPREDRIRRLNWRNPAVESRSVCLWRSDHPKVASPT